MKKIFILFSALLFTATMMASCESPVTPEPEPQPQDSIPAELQALKQSVVVTDNWVFDSKPSITIRIENPNVVSVDAAIKVSITTDQRRAAATIEKTVSVAANSSEDVVVTTDEAIAPGFYKANCFVNQRIARSFYFGINPTAIVSAPDKQPDFDEYWAAAKEQLDSIDMNAQLTLLEKKST
ncbi:MAG: hypothetical protein J6C57_08655, partial [Paludibacteraceae bacterium]|nr:hypothetical protein [Paludibacteraceae bacterium]